MDVIGVKGCSDLTNVTVDESLGPRHDGLGLGALFGRRRHVLDGERVGRRRGLGWSCISIYDQGLLRYSR